MTFKIACQMHVAPTHSIAHIQQFVQTLPSSLRAYMSKYRACSQALLQAVSACLHTSFEPNLTNTDMHSYMSAESVTSQALMSCDA